MERLIKPATLIDVLGILLPGAILVLAVNFYGLLDVAAPWKALFGSGDIPMLIYFAGASYLCGSVIHQLGAYLEKALAAGPMHKKNLHEKFWENEEVRSAYQKCFSKEPPTASADMTAEKLREEQIKAGKKIFHLIQQGERPQRIVLFSAFYAMSRAMVLTLICVAVMICCKECLELRTIGLELLCATGIVVFSLRWKQYEAMCVEEAYLLFVQRYCGNKNS